MEFREKLLQCLGGPWPAPRDLRPRLRETIVQDGYRIEAVTYEAEPGDEIPAYLLIPDGVDAAHPAPAVAVWHQHNAEWNLGGAEPAGLAGTPTQHTGVALAKEGYVVLCPDVPTTVGPPLWSNGFLPAVNQGTFISNRVQTAPKTAAGTEGERMAQERADDGTLACKAETTSDSSFSVTWWPASAWRGRTFSTCGGP